MRDSRRTILQKLSLITAGLTGAGTAAGSHRSRRQEPYLGEPHQVPGRIQAQHFDAGGQGVAYNDSTGRNRGGAFRTNEAVDIEATTDATGGEYNVGWIAAGEWLEYTVDVAEAGTYDVRFRVASLSRGGAVSASVDGADVTGTVSFDATGGWQNWTTVTANDVSLSAGVHTLRVTMEEDLFNLNWIDVSRVDSGGGTNGGRPYLDAPHQVPGRIQAQHFDAGGQGVAYNDTTSSNQGGAFRTNEAVDIEATTDATGGEYNVGWIAAGEWLEYTVDVAEAGTYDVRFRVASLSNGGTLTALVDGADVTGTVSFDATGGWQNWTTVTAESVTLPAGVHTLRVTMEEDLFNLNWIEIGEESAGEEPPTDENPDGPDGQWSLTVDEQWDTLDRSRWGLGFVDDWSDIPSDDGTPSWNNVAVRNNQCVLTVESEGTGPGGCYQGAITACPGDASHHPSEGIPIDPSPGVYVEARIQPPDYRPGLLPAFWMHPANQDWPPELDVVEWMYWNDPNIPDEEQLTHHTAHWTTSGASGDMGSHAYDPTDVNHGRNVTTEFNTYGMAWFEDRLEWYVNGELVKSLDQSSGVNWDSLNNPTSRPHGLILSCHVNRIGRADLDSAWSDDMVVDWLRVWQFEG